MHRRGRDEIGLAQQRTRGASEPTGKHRQPVAATAAFQVQHQLTGVVVIDQRRAGAVEGGRRAGASAADPLRARIVGQREAAAVTAWVQR